MLNTMPSGNADAPTESDSAPRLGTAPDVAASFYPETISPLRAQLPVINREFAELREAYLLGFGERTAMAYWGDLEQFHDWCQDERHDVLRPAPSALQNFLSEQTNRGYSPHTVARRLTALRGFYTTLVESELLAENPASLVESVSRPVAAAELRRRRQAARSRISARRLTSREYQKLLATFSTDQSTPHKQLSLLLQADGMSRAQVHRLREGDVIKRADGRYSVRVLDRGVGVAVTLRLPPAYGQVGTLGLLYSALRNIRSAGSNTAGAISD